MVSLKLDSRLCISCGICRDVCRPGAIALRDSQGASVEGKRLSFLLLDSPANRERPSGPMGTFPYLADPPACNGCLDCVRECPVAAIEIR